MLEDALRLVLEIWPPELRPSRTNILRREDFRPYQNRCAELIRECLVEGPKKRPGAILALPPGAGKTGVALTAVCDALDEGLIQKVLITAPVLVSQTTWPDEFDEWEHLKGTPWTLIRVEDDDSELLAVGARVYEQALARHRERWEAEVAIEARKNPSKASAKAIVRARWERAAFDALSELDQIKLRTPKKVSNKGLTPEAHAEAIAKAIEDAETRMPKAAPSDLAEKERQAAVAEAKEAKLRRLAAESTQIHIINKEALLWLWQFHGNGARWPYDLCIGDDLREFRSGKARSTGKVELDAKGKKKPAPLSRWGVLSRARKYMKAMIELTGTPMPKSIEDAWGLAFLVDLGERLGLSKTAFLDRWFNVNKYDHRVTPKGMKTDKDGNVLEVGWAFYEIMERLRDIMFSLDEKDIGGLPPFIIDPIRVQLPDQVMKAYREFARTSVSEEYDVEAVNGGVLHGKKLQFANGSMYRGPGDDVWIHDVKIQALQDLVARLDGKPLLVAYTFEFDVARILKFFPTAEVMTPSNARDFKRRWNEDKIVLGLVHRASAGHGLNMQKGTGHMCEYGLTTDAELYLQFLKRLYRPGRKTSVINHVIIAKGTIDEEVFPSYLNPKIDIQERAMAEVRLVA